MATIIIITPPPEDPQALDPESHDVHFVNCQPSELDARSVKLAVQDALSGD